MVKQIFILLFCFNCAAALAQSGGNGFPKALNDSYTMNEHDVLSIRAPGILGNDTVPGKAKKNVTIKLVHDVVSGDLRLEPDGSFVYFLKKKREAEAYAPFDTDRFSYMLFDGQKYSNEAVVTITVLSVNDPPVCSDDHYAVEANTGLDVGRGSGVLCNDKDPEGNFLTVELLRDVSHGVLRLNYDGSFLYTPDADYVGDDAFTYRASDGELASEEEIVMIDILPAEAVPDADPDPEDPEE